MQKSLAAIVSALLAASLVTSAADPPVPSGVTERTGISLQLLDVEVVDKHGNPIPGLTLDDFEVWIDGRSVELYSVDDLCECSASTAGSAASTPDVPQHTQAPTDATRPGNVVRYVLYFDFSQLQSDGRVVALDEARRWIAKSLPAGGEAMLVGYHPIRGVRQLSPFTDDRSDLIEVLTKIFDDPAWVDPFPSLFSSRVNSCPQCCTRCLGPCQGCCATECFDNPRQEYAHGRQAYRALDRFLQTLEKIPGPKALLMFHQNSIRSPEKYYPLVTEFEIGTHDSLLEQIGADAARSRTSINSAFVGNHLDRNSPSDQAVNVGANLADFTGGQYNRGETTLAQLTDDVAQRCACLYRIAFVQQGEASDRVHRVRVAAAGKTVPFRYRLQMLDEMGRWWRSARAVLEDPAAATDVGVRAAILPRARSRRGWELTAQVFLDADSLMLLPSAGEEFGRWEVGALLDRNEGKTWEMLGVSRLRSTRELPRDAGIVHERIFSEIPGGRYRMRAFVRDRIANAFGGGSAELELPKPGKSGMVGPIGREADRILWATQLPLRNKKNNEASESPTMKPRTGTVPATDHALEQGQRLSVRTWICPAKPGTPDSVVRYVSRGTEPLYRFEATTFEKAGDCFAVEDWIETRRLKTGSYAYHIRWKQRPDTVPIEGRLDFAVKHEARELVEVPVPARPVLPDPRLPGLLKDLSDVADRYLDNALRFTCDETISVRTDDRRTRYKFRYVYVYQDEQLLDYRLPRGRFGHRNLDRSHAVDLGELGLPGYLLRAYSWVMALFGAERQTRYAYALRGEEDALGRPAYVVSFDPIPPYVDEVNDWFGTAWIDRETHLLLRVRAYRIEDWDAVRIHERKQMTPEDSTTGYRTWQRFETEFDVHEREMAFPSLVEIRGFAYGAPDSPEGSIRELYRLTHAYRDYRFFEVHVR